MKKNMIRFYINKTPTFDNLLDTLAEGMGDIKYDKTCAINLEAKKGLNLLDRKITIEDRNISCSCHLFFSVASNKPDIDGAEEAPNAGEYLGILSFEEKHSQYFTFMILYLLSKHYDAIIFDQHNIFLHKNQYIADDLVQLVEQAVEKCLERYPVSLEMSVR